MSKMVAQQHNPLESEFSLANKIISQHSRLTSNSLNFVYFSSNIPEAYINP